MSVQLEIAAPVCTGCAVCIDSCPTDVLRMNAAGKAYAAFIEDCQSCFLCVIDCSVEAITLRQSKVEGVTLGPRRAATGL